MCRVPFQLRLGTRLCLWKSPRRQTSIFFICWKVVLVFRVSVWGGLVVSIISGLRFLAKDKCFWCSMILFTSTGIEILILWVAVYSCHYLFWNWCYIGAIYTLNYVGYFRLETSRMLFANIQFCRDKIREYKDESERLDQCSRLHDSSISNVNFELDASRIAQVGLFPLLKFFHYTEFMYLCFGLVPLHKD